MSLQDSACSKDNSIFAKPFQTGGLFPKPKHHSSKKNAHEEKIATYIAKILSNDKDQELEGLTGIRKLLSIADNRKSLICFKKSKFQLAPIQQVVDSGVVPKILSFMSPSEGPVFQVSQNLCKFLNVPLSLKLLGQSPIFAQEQVSMFNI